MRSWAAREKRFSRRPNAISGTTTSGTTSTTMPASFGLVATSRPSAPTTVSMLRSHIEIDEPTSACSSPVSAVMRERMSPVRAVSKNPGERVMTWS